MTATTLVIKYPNGSTQVVKPNLSYFKGDWNGLATAIGGQYFPIGTRINYELK